MTRSFIVILIAISTLAMLSFQGCSGFQAISGSSVPSSPSSFPVFSSSESNPTTPISSRTPDSSDVASTTSCTSGQSIPSLNALAAAIQSMAPASDQGTDFYYAGTCSVGLHNFAANAVNASGNTVNAIQFNSAIAGSPGTPSWLETGVALYCSNPSGMTGNADLVIDYFTRAGIRGPGIASTYLCVYGSNPNSCNPSSSSFIGGFVWGPNGSDYNDESGVTDFSDGGPETNVANPSSVIAEILVHGGQTFNDLDSCNGTVGLYSPLVIEKVADEGILTLNPFATSTYFDLTGDGSMNRISCVQSGAFLALPNANGQIVNINQLFGNNTVGIDGYKAATGFLALGKWDYKSMANGYGTISAKDAVFSKLRLWQDSNCDGIAQPSELIPLSNWNIQAIHWAGAVNQIEVDPFGNESKQRNSVYQSDGQVLRVFDLWFKSFGIL